MLGRLADLSLHFISSHKCLGGEAGLDTSFRIHHIFNRDM